jgi:hypothetical protein
MSAKTGPNSQYDTPQVASASGRRAKVDLSKMTENVKLPK